MSPRQRQLYPVLVPPWPCCSFVPRRLSSGDVNTVGMGNALGKAAAADFLLQWGLFLVAAYLKSEKFYDLAGSSTFILLVVQSLINSGKFFPRQVIQSGLVSTWAARLGLFLFFRILKDGHDSRFNRVRDNPRKFFLYWTVQGIARLVRVHITAAVSGRSKADAMGFWIIH